MGERLTSTGSSFHALTALAQNDRLANSVRACGTSRRPSTVARVSRADTSERRVMRERITFEAPVSCTSRYITHLSCSVTISSILFQPSSRSVSVTCSRYPRPVTIRAPKLMHFWSLRFCVAVQLPHTDTQYRKWGNTSASMSSRLVSRGMRRCIPGHSGTVSNSGTLHILTEGKSAVEARHPEQHWKAMSLSIAASKRTIILIVIDYDCDYHNISGACLRNHRSFFFAVPKAE